jgi:hypothetical protein
MKRYGLNGLLFLLMITSLTFLIGCGTSGSVGIKTGGGDDVVIHQPPVAKKGPPPWAPAHGHRAKYRYRYYQDCSVYYDTGRRIYFYMEANNWVASVSLPGHLSARLGDGYVNIDMDTDKPYTQYSDHKKKYPPGQAKKNKSDKWAYKGKKQ